MYSYIYPLTRTKVTLQHHPSTASKDKSQTRRRSSATTASAAGSIPSLSTSTLRIGVLLTDPVQLLDISSIDILSMLSKDYLSTITHLPPTIVNLGLNVDIHYIGKAFNCAGTFTECTAKACIKLTDSVHDESVAPGKGRLDILMIPGPDPGLVPDESVLEFVRGHDEAGTTLLVICTGCVIAGHAGVLGGRCVTGPRELVPMLRRKFPEAKKWDDSVRVVRDGKMWSSGGITNGHDMVVEYIRELYPKPLVDAVCSLADVGARKVEYEAGPTQELVYGILQSLKSVGISLFGRKGKTE